jgi:RNA polymerase sigma-70 factor, ECF subfamily
MVLIVVGGLGADARPRDVGYTQLLARGDDPAWVAAPRQQRPSSAGRLRGGSDGVPTPTAGPAPRGGGRPRTGDGGVRRRGGRPGPSGRVVTSWRGLTSGLTAALARPLATLIAPVTLTAPLAALTVAPSDGLGNGLGGGLGAGLGGALGRVRRPDQVGPARPGRPGARPGPRAGAAAPALGLTPPVGAPPVGAPPVGAPPLDNPPLDNPPVDTPEVVVDLVRRARDGESAAFGELYDHYVQLVHRYVMFRVGSVPLAEDIVSETFLRAWRRIDTFTWQSRDIGAWFITIARHLIIDDAKSSQSRLEFPVEYLPVGASAAPLDGPEETVLALLARRAVLDAVRGLKPDQRECLLLRFIEGLSVRETALAMGRNEGAVKSLQFRAARALARAVARTELA